MSNTFLENSKFPSLTVKVNIPFTSHREIKIDVCKYIWTIIIGQGAFLKEKRVLSQHCSNENWCECETLDELTLKSGEETSFDSDSVTPFPSSHLKIR